MSKQQSSMPSSPVTRRPLALSSATLTAEDTQSVDLLPRLELSISVRLLENFEIVLATTERSGQDAGNSPAERRELHTYPILLSLLPDVIHLAGGSHDDAAPRSYELTLTFSDGSSAAKRWSTTFEVPHSPLVDSPWHLTVPFAAEGNIRRNK